VTGKGGVGKTTVAAALGLVAARAGKRTIVAEVARRGDVASAFDREGAEPFEEIELAPGLFHISIDPQDALEEYLRDQLPRGPVAELLARSRVFGLLAAATPGMRELLTVGKLWELAQLERRTPGADAYDLVVVDAPATGHGVAVLTAPRTFAAAAGTGPVARQGRKIDATLSDPEQTAVIAVARAEEMAVSETGELRTALREGMGLEVERVIANALDPDRFDDDEAAQLEPHAGHPAVARALSGHTRALRQRAQLARLAELCEQEPARLALHPGGPDLERLADELAPQLDVADPVPAP
jgi:anion-transporting  ArsA/GET3 family ATPase